MIYYNKINFQTRFYHFFRNISFNLIHLSYTVLCWLLSGWIPRETFHTGTNVVFPES